MTLSMTSSISAADICHITCYKELKVFCLRGTDGSELVIKTDVLSDSQIKAAGKAIKVIESGSKMKIISAGERQELVNYCRFVEDLDAYFKDLSALGVNWTSTSQSADVALLKKSLNFGFPFTKMTKQTIHNIEDAAAARGTGSKDVMRLFVSTLKGKGGLEKLGRVIAADLYNANRDRFRPNSPSQPTIGPFTFNLRVTVNLGNIMIISTESGYEASVLDYVDPNSYFKDSQQPLATSEKTVDERWPGRILADKKLRSSFAHDVIHDLEALFNPKKSAFSLKTKLGRDAERRLESGIVNGARRISIDLATRIRIGNKVVPQGLRDRYAILSDI